MAYKATLTIDYELEADNEEDAIIELADLVRRDWLYYIDEFDLEVVKDEPSQAQSQSQTEATRGTSPPQHHPTQEDADCGWWQR